MSSVRSWVDAKTTGAAQPSWYARSQFAAVEVALRRRGLPVEVVGLGGLLTTPEVVDVVATIAAHVAFVR